MLAETEQMKKLLVIEPNLRNSSGHYAEFVRAVGSRVSGSLLEVFAHPDADQMLDEMPGVMTNRSSPRVGAPLAEWRTIHRCVSANSPFLVLTADGRHAAAASLFSRCAGIKPVHANFFFHRAPTTARDNCLYPLTGIAREHSRAITSTEEVAGSLTALGWRNVDYIPYPALAPVIPPGPLPFSHLLMAGAARLNKGLDIIAGLAGMWAGEGRSIPLLVQVSQKHASRHGHREAGVVQDLFSSGYLGLHADDTVPDRAEYSSRFRGALVLAPYAREQFASQVSGIVLDALLHGAPVIATTGTWPGAQVERFCAGVTIAERTPEALAAAIDLILADWSAYSTRASVAAQVLAQEHDPRRLLEIMGLEEP